MHITIRACFLFNSLVDIGFDIFTTCFVAFGVALASELHIFLKYRDHYNKIIAATLCSAGELISLINHEYSNTLHNIGIDMVFEFSAYIFGNSALTFNFKSI